MPRASGCRRLLEPLTNKTEKQFFDNGRGCARRPRSIQTADEPIAPAEMERAFGRMTGRRRHGTQVRAEASRSARTSPGAEGLRSDAVERTPADPEAEGDEDLIRPRGVGDGDFR